MGKSAIAIYNQPQETADLTKKILTVLILSVLIATMFASLSLTSAAKPSLTISPSSGCIDDTVTVSGSGFAHNAHVSIEAFKFETTSDKTGRFEGKATILGDILQTAGTYDIVAKDSSGNEAHASFTLRPKITLAPALGASGSVVTVVGKGFSADAVGDKLLATFDGKELKLEHLQNGETRGAFSATFTVPDILPSSYTVTVASQKEPEINASADFVVSALMVTPENPFGALLAVFACVAAVVLYMKRARR
jgi:hypothetical protein